MTETTIDFENLLKQKEKAKKMLHKWQNKVSELTNLINSSCVHTKTIVVNDYEEGGYLDRAVYHRITKCAICNKEISRKSTYGDYA